MDGYCCTNLNSLVQLITGHFVAHLFTPLEQLKIKYLRKVTLGGLYPFQCIIGEVDTEVIKSNYRWKNLTWNNRGLYSKVRNITKVRYNTYQTSLIVVWIMDTCDFCANFWPFIWSVVKLLNFEWMLIMLNFTFITVNKYLTEWIPATHRFANINTQQKPKSM